MSTLAVAARAVARPQSTLLRSLGIVVIGGLVLLLLSELLSQYNDLQLATGAYYFVVLAGLTVLIGVNGQISIGHGGFMAVGAYAVALLVGEQGWALGPALVAAAAASAVIGLLVGVAATRLRGPYLAGVTLAFAIGITGVAEKFSGTFGGDNGLTINPPVPPSWLGGTNFALERWEAWIACAGALVVTFLLYNLLHSATGRRMRAVRDDEIAAALCGLHVGRTQTFTFVASAACAGLGGGLLTVVLQLASPEAFPLQLSLSLLTAVVLGGLGSLTGAIWGAALLVLLPGWSTGLSHSFSLSQNVAANLQLGIYGVILIAAMLAWPSGIQGGLWAIWTRIAPRLQRFNPTERGVL
jgi:branched-chain amino acid transport system permease protein